MKKVFNEVNTLDKKCYNKYFLSEDILMEHAALAMFNHIKNKFKKKSTILIVCGSGNNGADGIVLARLLYKYHNIQIFFQGEAKSDIAILQVKRTRILNLKFIKDINHINKIDILVDCLFGSGLNRVLNKTATNLINTMNKIDAYKLSCDIPSGINTNGQVLSSAFISNTTITMGALKKCLYTDIAKDYVGNIIRCNLGVHEDLYENKSSCYLLEKSDLKLPYRKKKNTNKGSFGHLSVVLGNKKGAGIISCETALSFGVGSVTAITSEKNLPYSIMYNDVVPEKTSALAIGMGLGKNYDNNILKNNLPMLIDADLFYEDIILEIIRKKNIVLSPHPKEFCSLLKISSICNIDINTLQNNRFKYLNDFCTKYPDIVVLLKGSNVLIQKNQTIYINSLGRSNLSFAGSGDILAGLIASLLAQGYDTFKATIQASLAHTIAANNFKGNDYSLNPKDLIEEIKIL